jgi:hypothetical protein
MPPKRIGTSASFGAASRLFPSYMGAQPGFHKFCAAKLMVTAHGSYVEEHVHRLADGRRRPAHCQ